MLLLLVSSLSSSSPSLSFWVLVVARSTPSCLLQNFFWKASVFCSSVTEACTSFLSRALSKLVWSQPASTKNFNVHNAQNNPHFQTLSTLNRHIFGGFFWIAYLDLSSEGCSSLHCEPVASKWALQRASKGLFEHLAQLKRLKCYWSKLLVHCSAFPHVIDNSSCLQTKLQTNVAVVLFIVGWKSVVIFSWKMEFTKRTVWFVGHQC